MKTNHFLLIFALLAFCIIPVSATIPITVDSLSQNYISWSWPAGSTITKMTIDGITVCNFDPTGSAFTLSGLGPNEPHTLILYNASQTGSSTATTGADTTVYAELTGTVNTWIYLFIIIAFIILGYTFRRKLLMCIIFNVLSSIISVYALSVWLDATAIQVTDIWHIQYFIFLFFFVLGLILIVIERR